MISLNRATIIGNLTRDPELRYTPNGQSVTSFSVASNRRYKNSQGALQEEAEFHEVVAWAKLAEIICQLMRKGNKIYIEGRLRTRNWDAPDGSKRYRTEIIAENFVPLSPRATPIIGAEETVETPVNQPTESAPTEKAKPAKEEKEKMAEPTEEEDINLDDIPF